MYFINHYKAKLRWLPAYIFAIAIFIFSGMPGEDIHESYEYLETSVQAISTPAVPNTTPSTAAIQPPFDLLKVAHGIGYFLLGFSVLFALPAHSRWSPSIALLLCSLYSFSDELHQLFIPGRSASATDMLIDTLAALIGVAIMLGIIASRNYFTEIQLNRKTHEIR